MYKGNARATYKFFKINNVKFMLYTRCSINALECPNNSANYMYNKALTCYTKWCIQYTFWCILWHASCYMRMRFL